jgi:hypothetical protein
MTTTFWFATWKSRVQSQVTRDSDEAFPKFLRNHKRSSHVRTFVVDISGRISEAQRPFDFQIHRNHRDKAIVSRNNK